MNPTRTKWQTEVAAGIPDDPIRRNAAITARYARWYVDHPDLNKWAGMAVFASFRIGQILALERRLGRLGVSPGIRSGVELLRSTNDRVFEDIGWVHAAWLSPAGGIAAVEEGLADLPSHAGLLRGFRHLEAGRGMLQDDPQRAADVIWEGASQVLRHEQEAYVQTQLARLGPWFGALFSLTAVTNYSLGGGHREPTRWFCADMLRDGRPLVRRTGWLPSLADLDQRWFWIEHHALPLWRRIDAESPALRERMVELAEGAP